MDQSLEEKDHLGALKEGHKFFCQAQPPTPA